MDSFKTIFFFLILGQQMNRVGKMWRSRGVSERRYKSVCQKLAHLRSQELCDNFCALFRAQNFSIRLVSPPPADILMSKWNAPQIMEAPCSTPSTPCPPTHQPGIIPRTARNIAVDSVCTDTPNNASFGCQEKSLPARNVKVHYSVGERSKLILVSSPYKLQ